jgi:hypothetical protein
MSKKSPTKKQNVFKQAARAFGLPLFAVYAALFMVVVIAVGVVFSSQASTQQQALRSKAANYQIVGCNQACASNRNCEPNHFCYRGRCRLASNPESEICSPDSPAVSSELKGGDQNNIDEASNTDQAATDSSSTTQESESGTDSLTDQSEAPGDESFAGIESSGLLDKLMGEDNSQLFLVLGLGAIGLLVVVALITILSTSKNSKKDEIISPPDFTNLEKK